MLLDASVLYPAPLRDVLMYLHLHGLIQAKWTVRIHQEWMNAVQRQRPDLSWNKLERTRALMELNAPDAMVVDYAEIESSIQGLPDADDAHVMAAAVKCGADLILTFNLKHFPNGVLEPLGVRALHPDAFLCELAEDRRKEFCTALREHRQNLLRPPKTVREYLDTLLQQQLVKTVALLEDSGEEL